MRKSHYGNRPIDVCALCDRPITTKGSGFGGLHLYVGPGMCHGGAREYIPCHNVCLTLGDDRYDELLRNDRDFKSSPLYALAVAYYQKNLLPS